MNKQRGIIIFIMVLAFNYVWGQDKIVTTQQDTIFCKIVSISLKAITYEQEGYANTTSYQSIPIEQVREYSLGSRPQKFSLATPGRGEPVTKPFQATPDKKQSVKPYQNPPNKFQPAKPAVQSKKQEDDSFQRWRVGFQGGGSYLLNSLAPSREAMKNLGVVPVENIKNYYKQLRKGIAAGADAYYMVSHSWGVGLKYSFFLSSTQKDLTVGSNDADVPTYYNTNEKEQWYIHYLGPSVFFRQWLSENHKFSLSEELSAGYILYYDKVQYDPYQYLFVNPQTNTKQYNLLKEGKTFSGIFQLSLEYYPSPEISIGLSAGGSPLILRKLKISDSDTSSNQELGKTNQLDLSRVDCSFGIHFHF